MTSRFAAALLLLAFATTGANGACDKAVVDKAMDISADGSCAKKTTDCAMKTAEQAADKMAEWGCKCNEDNAVCLETALKDSGCAEDEAAKGVVQPTIDSARKLNTDSGCKAGGGGGDDAASAAQASAFPSFVALTILGSMLLLAVARA